MTSSEDSSRDAGDSARETAKWYESYYRSRGGERNDLLRNPEVLFQTLAVDAAIIRALRATGLDPTTAKVLDIGCGSGASLPNFLRLGFLPDHIYGVDILAERIERAALRYTGSHFTCCDARRLLFRQGEFDVVFESTMFVQLTDETLATEIASEMLRVTRPGGFLLLVDWRYGKPWDPSYAGLSSRRLVRLFKVGSASRHVRRFRGALVPPVGRWLSRYCPAGYFLAQALLPVLVANVATLLRKEN